MRRKINFSLSRQFGFGLLRASLRLEGKASAFPFLPYNLWKVVLVSLGKSQPLSLLMGKKSAKPHKEKMPACPEQYFSGIGELLRLNVGLYLLAAVLIQRGGVQRAFTERKGGSDPVLLFGPQAGRKEGVAPALLPYSRTSGFASLVRTSHALSVNYGLRDRKTARKTVPFPHGFPHGQQSLGRLLLLTRITHKPQLILDRLLIKA